MIIQLTPQAETKLKEKIGDNPGSVRLIYDTEGCGCAVNGVPGLRIIDQPDINDISVDTVNSIPFVINRRQEVFFEEQLNLDVDRGALTFRLDSSAQSYGTNIQLVDMRN